LKDTTQAKRVLRATYAGKTMPYAKAVIVGNMIYCSGMGGIVAETHSVPVGITERESVRKQTEVAVKKIQSILQEAGSSLEHVVQALILVEKLEFYETMLEVFREMGFPLEDVAQTLFEARLNQGTLIEVQVVAVIPK